MSWINYHNLFGCIIKKNLQEHSQIGKSYIGKIKIYLNDAKPIVDRELKPWQKSNVNLAVYTNLGLNILLFRVQIKSHMVHFQI